MAAVIAVNTLTDTAGVPVNDAIWSAANRRFEWICKTSRLCQTGQSEEEREEDGINSHNRRHPKLLPIGGRYLFDDTPTWQFFLTGQAGGH